MLTLKNKIKIKICLGKDANKEISGFYEVKLHPVNEDYFQNI